MKKNLQSSISVVGLAVAGLLVSSNVSAVALTTGGATDSATSQAAEVGGGDADRARLLGATVSIGLVAGVAPDYEGSNDYDAFGLPVVRMNWDSGRYLKLGPGLEVNLLPNKIFAIGPMAQFRRNAWAETDDNTVDNLKGDGDALEVGLFMGFDDGTWDGRWQLAKDINAGHDGWISTLRFGYKMPIGAKSKLRLGVETFYGSDSYTESYFAIDAENSLRSGLPQYDTDGGLRDVGLTATYFYNVSPSWTLLGHLGVKRLVGDAADSPVVDDEGSDNQVLGAVGFIYHF